jgi:hypothetical protein
MDANDPLTAARQQNQFVMEIFQSYVNIAIGTAAVRLLAKDMVWSSLSHWLSVSQFLKVVTLLFVVGLTTAQGFLLKAIMEIWSARAVRHLLPTTTHDKQWARILILVGTTLVVMSAWFTVNAAAVFLGNATP